MANVLPQYNGITTSTGIPGVLPVGGGAGQDQANINALLNPYFNQNEVLTNAAEKNFGSGVPGSGFGLGTSMQLLESEKIARQKLGNQMLEPYLQRQQQSELQSNAEAARLNEIAAQGAQALQQLQLQEAGLTSRATAQENAALQRQIQEGKDAMGRLTVSEAGQTGRSNAGIAGTLANTKLGIGGNLLSQYFKDLNGRTPGGGTASGAYAVPGGYYPNALTVGPAKSGGSNGMSALDGILAKYGLRG